MGEERERFWEEKEGERGRCGDLVLRAGGNNKKKYSTDLHSSGELVQDGMEWMGIEVEDGGGVGNVVRTATFHCHRNSSPLVLFPSYFRPPPSFPSLASLCLVFVTCTLVVPTPKCFSFSVLLQKNTSTVTHIILVFTNQPMIFFVLWNSKAFISNK